MSVKAIGEVFDLDLPRNEKFVLLAYVDHADHNGGNIYPAVATIMRKTGYEERSVQTITRKLEQRGLLVPDGKGPKGTNKWKYPLGRGAEFAGVQKETKKGRKKKQKGVQPTAPEPPLTPKKQPSVKEGASAKPKATDFPELVLFREVVKHWPKQHQRDTVIESIQKINKRLGRKATAEDLEPFWKQWGVVSGNDWSIVWLVEWAVSGVMRTNGNGHKPSGKLKNTYNAIDRVLGGEYGNA